MAMGWNWGPTVACVLLLIILSVVYCEYRKVKKKCKFCEGVQINDDDRGIDGDINKCPCGNSELEIMECTECHQPVKRCTKCFRYLSRFDSNKGRSLPGSPTNQNQQSYCENVPYPAYETNGACNISQCNIGDSSQYIVPKQASQCIVGDQFRLNHEPEEKDQTMERMPTVSKKEEKEKNNQIGNVNEQNDIKIQTVEPVDGSLSTADVLIIRMTNLLEDDAYPELGDVTCSEMQESRGDWIERFQRYQMEKRGSLSGGLRSIAMRNGGCDYDYDNAKNKFLAVRHKRQQELSNLSNFVDAAAKTLHEIEQYPSRDRPDTASTHGWDTNDRKVEFR